MACVPENTSFQEIRNLGEGGGENTVFDRPRKFLGGHLTP